MTEQALQQLFDEFSEENRDAYHNGFIQGAVTLAHLLAEGMPIEKALEACKNHKFFLTVD